MNKKAFFKNISYTLGSNVLSFVISVIAVLVVPRFLGVELYGYFQLYIFYVNYIGFFHFGWADGVYLRYGGAYYDELDKHKMSGQFWGLFFFEALISISIGLYGVLCVSEEQRTAVLLCTAIAVVLVLPRTLLQYLLQCTNRIKENAVVVTVERIGYLVFVLVVLFVGIKDFLPVVIADLIGKLIALVFALYYCRSIVKSAPERVVNILQEAKDNISVGIKLMFSNVASLLIIGIVRYAMERRWDIVSFGKVSLSISVSNMLMVMVTAVSLVMFPTLRRINNDQYAHVYITIRSILMYCLLGMLIVYYPAKLILSAWLPQYADSLRYMAILFPMCVFESKYSMLINTYMKTLRKEDKLLLVNSCSMVLSFLFTWLTVFCWNSMDLAILSIVLLLAFRCIFAELIVTRSINIDEKKDIVLEVLVVTVFILSNWVVGGLRGMLLYVLCFVIYLFIKKEDIKVIVNYCSNVIQSRIGKK